MHVRVWKCADGACNCGVAAREGDDVVSVDMCGNSSSPIPFVKRASKGQLSHGTSVKKDRSGKSFIVSTMILVW